MFHLCSREFMMRGEAAPATLLIITVTLDVSVKTLFTKPNNGLCMSGRSKRATDKDKVWEHMQIIWLQHVFAIQGEAWNRPAAKNKHEKLWTKKINTDRLLSSTQTDQQFTLVLLTSMSDYLKVSATAEQVRLPLPSINNLHICKGLWMSCDMR